MVKMTKRFSNAGDGTNGAFMGFDTSESDDTDTSDLEQGNRHLDDVSKMLACDLQHMSELLLILNTFNLCHLSGGGDFKSANAIGSLTSW